MNPDDLIHSRDAAQILGRTVSSVHRYTEIGRLHAVAQGYGKRGAKLFLRSDVEALAAELARGEAA